MDGAAHQGVPRLFCTYYQLRNLPFKWFSIEEYAPAQPVPQSQTRIHSRPRCFVSCKNSPVCVYILSYYQEIKANSCFWFCKHSTASIFVTCSSDIAVQRVGYCEGPPAVFGFMYVCIVFCCYFCILSSPGAKRGSPKGPSAKLARAVNERQSPSVGLGKDFRRKNLSPALKWL